MISIAELKLLINNLASKRDTDQQLDINELKTKIDGQTSDIDGNQQSDVNELKAQINKQTSDVDSNQQADINELKAKIDGQTSDIDTNQQSDVNELKAKIDNLGSILTPTRGTVTQELTNISLGGGNTKNVDKHDFSTYSSIIVTLRVTYGTSPSNGVRVRWLYNQNGTDYDTFQDAENAGNYKDLTYGASGTRQRTVAISILTPYLRIQIVNLDGTHGVTIDSCYTLLLR